MPAFTTGDGVELVYTDTGADASGGTDRPTVVLLHGWGFSRRFFDPVIPPLAAHLRVVAPDLRGHGDSGPPSHSLRVARLGADLEELLAHLDLRDVTLLGWSLGCAVAWSHLELFGSGRVVRLVLSSQVPRQYVAEDWPWHHAQCYDDAALAAFCTRIDLDLPALLEEQADEITATGADDALRSVWITEMTKCSAATRTSLMTDHTRHDWRDFLPTLQLPILILQGKLDAAYDWQGVTWIAEHVPHGAAEVFDRSAHALFHDEPERFVRAVGDFVLGRHLVDSRIVGHQPSRRFCSG